MNKINALAESDITKAYAKPTTPNIVPRDKIPEINIIIEITLVITIIPLFSFAKNCDEYNVDIVVGMIDKEIIGISSKDSEYSGNKICKI
tara:strand:+ start:335 stop:604 length:270 start_codon:yes stop_codon:yes gene_type:complete